MKYFVYKILFNVAINSTQKEALNAFNRYLPNRIIINTSIPLLNKFALGEEIGNELEVESESQFDINTLNVAITMANEDLGSDIIKSVTPINTNIVDEEETEVRDISIDLVDLSK